MPKIDLYEFFYGLKHEKYCIIKIKKDFPDYSAGEDVDVFCYNILSFSKKILEIGNTYVLRGFEIKVTNLPEYRQIYIDFFYNQKMEFRFDLYASLPVYKNINIRPALFLSIIEQAVPTKRYFQNQQFNIYLPNAIDDLLIRYIEYHEWYKVRLDKIKHLEYILKNTDEQARISLLEKLHEYTELPPSGDILRPEQKKYTPHSGCFISIKRLINQNPVFGRILQSFKSLIFTLKK